MLAQHWIWLSEHIDLSLVDMFDQNSILELSFDGVKDGGNLGNILMGQTWFMGLETILLSVGWLYDETSDLSLGVFDCD